MARAQASSPIPLTIFQSAGRRTESTCCFEATGQRVSRCGRSRSSAARRPSEARLISPEFSAARTIGVAPGGDLYYLKRAGFRQVYEAQVDFESGRLLQEPEPIATTFVGDNYDPVYSPDGRRMAYVSNRSLQDFASPDSNIIVVRDLETGSEVEVDPGVIGAGNLAWTYDSSRLLFKARNRNRNYAVYQTSVEGERPQLLFEPNIFGWSEGNKKKLLKLVLGAGGAGTSSAGGLWRWRRPLDL